MFILDFFIGSLIAGIMIRATPIFLSGINDHITVLVLSYLFTQMLAYILLSVVRQRNIITSARTYSVLLGVQVALISQASEISTALIGNDNASFQERIAPFIVVVVCMVGIALILQRTLFTAGEIINLRSRWGWSRATRPAHDMRPMIAAKHEPAKEAEDRMVGSSPRLRR